MLKRENLALKYRSHASESGGCMVIRCFTLTLEKKGENIRYTFLGSLVRKIFHFFVYERFCWQT